MSGRNSARFTFLPVNDSMSRASSGLGSCRPVTIKENHVLLMPNFRAKAIIDPLGLSAKYSRSVIVYLSLVKRILHQKKLLCNPALNMVQFILFNLKANHAR